MKNVPVPPEALELDPLMPPGQRPDDEPEDDSDNALALLPEPGADPERFWRTMRELRFALKAWRGNYSTCSGHGEVG